MRPVIRLALMALALLAPAAAFAQSRVLAVNDTEATSVKGESFALFQKLVTEKRPGGPCQ